jgi:hypothetical protein
MSWMVLANCSSSSSGSQAQPTIDGGGAQGGDGSAGQGSPDAMTSGGDGSADAGAAGPCGDLFTCVGPGDCPVGSSCVTGYDHFCGAYSKCSPDVVPKQAGEPCEPTAYRGIPMACAAGLACSCVTRTCQDGGKGAGEACGADGECSAFGGLSYGLVCELPDGGALVASCDFDAGGVCQP